VPLTRGWVRHLFRTCGRPSCRTVWSRRAVAWLVSGDDEGHLKVSQRVRPGTLPVQPCATTRVAVTSESLLDGVRENYTSSFSQPPRNRIVTPLAGIVRARKVNEQTIIRFRTLRLTMSIQVCLSWLIKNNFFAYLFRKVLSIKPAKRIVQIRMSLLVRSRLNFWLIKV